MVRPVSVYGTYPSQSAPATLFKVLVTHIKSVSALQHILFSVIVSPLHLLAMSMQRVLVFKVAEDLYWDRGYVMGKKKFPTPEDQIGHWERVRALLEKGVKFRNCKEIGAPLMVVKIPIPLQPGVLEYIRVPVTHVTVVHGLDEAGRQGNIPVNIPNSVQWAMSCLETSLESRVWPSIDTFPGFLAMECVIHPHYADPWKELQCLSYELAYLSDLLSSQTVAFPYIDGICHKIDFSWNPTRLQIDRIEATGVPEECLAR